MVINYVEVPIAIKLVWDIQPLLSKLQKKHNCLQGDLILLCSSSQMLLPSGVMPEGLLAGGQLFDMLWEKEKEKIYALARGL